MELEPVEESEKETALEDNTSGSTETQDRDQATEKE